jgi:hypothetical protein
MAWAPLYATEDELRAYVRDVPSADEADEGVANNALIYTPALTAASREIDRSCGRQFGETDDGMSPTAVEFLYTPRWIAERGAYTVSIADLFSDTDLVVTSSDTVLTDYTLLPLNAEAQGKPWTYLLLGSGAGSSTEGSLAIEAHWGWTAVPDTIKNATLLQASRIVKRRDAPFGVAGSPDMGNELRLLAKLDPDVEVMVGAYRRYW